MKPRASILILLLILLLISLRPALCATPFSYQFYNSDGTAQTNPITMTAWPPATNTWTVYGTNIVYGAQNITLTPNASGYGTNYAYPNTYRLFVSNLNSGFFIALPDTTNQISLGSCLIAAPQTAGPLGLYGMITNWLGYAPATNSNLGIRGALGYVPLTNTLAGITNVLGYIPLTNTYAAITNTAGFVPATNGLAALTNTLTDAALAGIHGYRPATNTVAGFTNVLGFTLQAMTYANLTNALGFKPPTNPPLALTAVLPFITPGSITNQLYITNGYVTKTNWP